MEIVESTFNRMAPRVHLICSILLKECKFCTTSRRSFHAGIYELSCAAFRQRLAVPPGTMRDPSGFVARFFLPAATAGQCRPGQRSPSGSTVALACGWSWNRGAAPAREGDGVTVPLAWPGSGRSLHARQRRDIVSQPTVSSPT